MHYSLSGLISPARIRFFFSSPRSIFTETMSFKLLAFVLGGTGMGTPS